MTIFGDINTYMFWLTAGIFLMVLEIVTPGIYFLWVGLGALVTGIISLIIPSLSGSALGVIFAILAIISALTGRKLMLKRQAVPTGLNDRMGSYVGKVYPVFEQFVDGRGKIKIGDSVWQAEAASNLSVGDQAKVVGTNGTVLKVELADVSAKK